MSRIFLALSVLVVVLLFVGNIHGFLAGDYNAIWRERAAAQGTHLDSSANDPASDLSRLTDTFRRTQRQNRIHTLMGLFVSLIGVLVQSLSITYFIGTGRWCKEVTQAYQLEEQPWIESVQLKRRCFPWAMLGIGTLLAMAATGAAADPGTFLPSTDRWVRPHAVIAIVGTIIVCLALAKQYDYLCRNQRVIERIVEYVRAIRQQKGLDVELRNA